MELIERWFRLFFYLIVLFCIDNLEGSLSDFLKNNDLRVSQLIQMCYDIAKGMQYLEKRNVIHR